MLLMVRRLIQMSPTEDKTSHLEPRVVAVTPGIPEDKWASHIWNVDETNFQDSTNSSMSEKVVAGVGLGPATVPVNKARESFSLVATICANGKYLSPLFIVKRAGVNCGWEKYFDGDAAFIATPNGNMQQDCFGHYLHWFQRNVRASRTNPVVLILDNHSSHITADNIMLAWDLGIHLMGLPSNTTEVTQPLDAAYSGAPSAGSRCSKLGVLATSRSQSCSTSRHRRTTTSHSRSPSSRLRSPSPACTQSTRTS